MAHFSDTICRSECRRHQEDLKEYIIIKMVLGFSQERQISVSYDKNIYIMDLRIIYLAIGEGSTYNTDHRKHTSAVDE